MEDNVQNVCNVYNVQNEPAADAAANKHPQGIRGWTIDKRGLTMKKQIATKSHE